MFDSATAELLRSAPKLESLDPNDLPRILTMHYAQIVSERLQGAENGDTSAIQGGFSLEKIADIYELITLVQDAGSPARRASAFVAATAQQIIARRQKKNDDVVTLPSITRQRLDPAIAAILLFLISEQYADAHEAVSAVNLNPSVQVHEASILTEHIRNLGRGELGAILERADRWRKSQSKTAVDNNLETRAVGALLQGLIMGVELMAGELLMVSPPAGIPTYYAKSTDAFIKVLGLCSHSESEGSKELGGSLDIFYAGIRHLALLLIKTQESLQSSALTKISLPNGADQNFWWSWIRYRANKFPFIWHNHREVLKKGFHESGNSAVLVLPTGAGKTTISSLKIANTIAQNKKVVFLAPTHALVDQLTQDLQEMFPEELLGSIVSSDFDLLFQEDSTLQKIEVMTPERCLAMLSFMPEAFSDVGLLVFDECHLLAPSSAKIRRALDGMLCVLLFNRVVPEADMLFLSAMIKNGDDFAEWISGLTSRKCLSVDLLWKPSRQARGVVLYEQGELERIKTTAIAVQRQASGKKKKANNSLSSKAKKELIAHPYAIWGLQHDWLVQDTAYCTFNQISKTPVPLSASIKGGDFWLTPNANEVAAKIAVNAAKNGLKTIIFVNNKAHAVSTASRISDELDKKIGTTELEEERWQALKIELGDVKHSILTKLSSAVPHNADMFLLERDLAERMYRRTNGASVIVATPTLAQGLNLPAELAILAGDKRAGEQGTREALGAHEILNAAARAGRAGHLANGVVLLIPEPLISFSEGEGLNRKTVEKLQLVLPEDDRCIEISDPLEIVLDRIMAGNLLDKDVQYTLNRVTTAGQAEGVETAVVFNLNHSFAAYRAYKRKTESEFAKKIEALNKAVESQNGEDVEEQIAILSSQSGIPCMLLARLKERLNGQLGALPNSVEDWLVWMLSWLEEDAEARGFLLQEVEGAIRSILGLKPTDVIDAAALKGISSGMVAWIEGLPIRDIEKRLGGDPDSDAESKVVCPKARDLINTVITRGMSFIIGLISQVALSLSPSDKQEELRTDVIECLAIALRRGYDAPEKVSFANSNRNILSRVMMHKAYEAASHDIEF